MSVFDQARELEEKLPAFLTQEYETGYEVIVIDETSTDDTSDVLKRFKNDYPHLYTTFLPKPNRQAIRKKFAFNLGIKAAKNEWIIFTKVAKLPAASDLLQAINDAMDDSAELTLGYISKKGIRLQPFTAAEEARRHIMRLERKLGVVHERTKQHYFWGRYDFIIVRKDQAYDVLKYFECEANALQTAGWWISILWSNMIRRPSTTMLLNT